MSDSEDALKRNLLAADQASRELAGALTRLRAALAASYSRSEQLSAHGDYDSDRAARLMNAMASAELISADLTRLNKQMAPLIRESRPLVVAKSR